MVPLCFDREETFLLQFSIKFRKTNKKSKRLRLFCTATTNFPAVPYGVDLASAEAEIRHVFGFTSITEASIGAASPGNNIAQCCKYVNSKLYGESCRQCKKTAIKS